MVEDQSHGPWSHSPDSKSKHSCVSGSGQQSVFLSSISMFYNFVVAACLFRLELADNKAAAFPPQGGAGGSRDEC